MYSWHIQEPKLWIHRYFVNVRHLKRRRMEIYSVIACISLYSYASQYLLFWCYCCSVRLLHFHTHQYHQKVVVVVVAAISRKFWNEHHRRRANVFWRNELTFNNTFRNFKTVSLLPSATTHTHSRSFSFSYSRTLAYVWSCYFDFDLDF